MRYAYASRRTCAQPPFLSSIYGEFPGRSGMEPYCTRPWNNMGTGFGLRWGWSSSAFALHRAPTRPRTAGIVLHKINKSPNRVQFCT
jgi:hypothetical protein